MDEKVEEYIEKQQAPQKEILKKIRNLILESLPNYDEKAAWGVVTFAGGKFYIAELKNKVHIGFAINGLSKEEISQFEGSGKTLQARLVLEETTYFQSSTGTSLCVWWHGIQANTTNSFSFRYSSDTNTRH